MADVRSDIRPLVAVALLSAIPATPALAATPGPDCTIRETAVTETRNLDPRHLGTLGRPTSGRPAATVHRPSVWKTRPAPAPSTTTSG